MRTIARSVQGYSENVFFRSRDCAVRVGDQVGVLHSCLRVVAVHHCRLRMHVHGTVADNLLVVWHQMGVVESPQGPVLLETPVLEKDKMSIFRSRNLSSRHRTHPCLFAQGQSSVLMLEPVGESRVRHPDALLPREIGRLVERLLERSHFVTVLGIVGRRREQALDRATRGQLPFRRGWRVGGRAEMSVVEVSASTRPVGECPPLFRQLNRIRRAERIPNQRV